MHVEVFILIAVVLSVIGQLCVKKGINLLGSIDFSAGLFGTYLKVFSSPLVIVGSLVYIAAIFFWIYSLSKVDLSFAYPFVSLTYVLIIVSAWIFLGENISLIRWFGIAAICIGIILVSRS